MTEKQRQISNEEGFTWVFIIISLLLLFFIINLVIEYNHLADAYNACINTSIHNDIDIPIWQIP